MTTTDLEKGQAIQDSISDLKSALSQINSAKIFNTDDGMSPCRRTADPFLSELNMEIRAVAVKKINDKIGQLSDQFEKL